METRAQFQQFIKEFLDRYGDAVYELSYRRIVRPIPIFIGLCRDIDITVFQASENELDQRGIPISFDRRPYTYTTSILMLDSSGLYINNNEHIQSTVLMFGCEKEGAREEWYSDFAHYTQTQYNLLGHIVDWLRTLSKEITIQCLRLENDDP
ncbi:hypothetical protein N7530_002343 [Penicillium desertorum]|uniref:Uncharacterized protein n=1 Tax=Penicillium desertorum TaxID=1303715 RepID=A0A9W9XBP9_9EURO|nr:hypothetical protein N7530_002343 [Penicillium desertorum]